MIKILLFVTFTLLFTACSSDKELQNVAPKLVVGQKLQNIQLKDQFGKSHTLNSDTYRVIFAFSKDAAHTCNDFFNTKKPDYIQNHHAAFIADVSAAPSLIRTLFILPGLKDFKHIVLLLDDKKSAAPYRKGIDTQSIIIVSILNDKITAIQSIKTSEALRKILEDDSPLSFIAPMMNQVMHTLD